MPQPASVGHRVTRCCPVLITVFSGNAQFNIFHPRPKLLIFVKRKLKNVTYSTKDLLRFHLLSADVIRQ